MTCSTVKTGWNVLNNFANVMVVTGTGNVTYKLVTDVDSNFSAIMLCYKLKNKFSFC